MNPIVRKATLDDMPVLLKFKRGLIEAEMPMDPNIKEGTTSYYDIPELMAAENSEVFVVELNGEVVASGYAKILADRHYMKHTHQGYLGFMYVPLEHRGKGLNKLILDALLKWCKERQVFQIRLDVYDVNKAALRAYEKAGFEKYLVNMSLDIEHMEF